MQRTARELNLSETVFFLPGEDTGDARVRIFTPANELTFAGHPVLGSAFVLGETLGTSALVLETGAGPIPVVLERNRGQISFGRMEQPVPVPEPYEDTDALLAALGVPRSGLPVEAYRNGPRHVYVELASETEVAALWPDQRALGHLPVAVSTFAGRGAAWKTRMFSPFHGVPEDPATGSAAGPLAVHLARHGRIAFGDEIEIRQGAEIGRPSGCTPGPRVRRTRWSGCWSAGRRSSWPAAIPPRLTHSTSSRGIFRRIPGKRHRATSPREKEIIMLWAGSVVTTGSLACLPTAGVDKKQSLC